MKKTVALLYLLICFYTAFSQVEREPPQGEEAPELKLNRHRVYGKMMDGSTGKALDGASVRLFLQQKDQADSLVTGILTKPNGDFSFSNLVQGANYLFVFSAVGYETKEQKLTIEKEEEKDLGNIGLQTEVRQLNNVTVVSSRPALEMGIDRKVFNVEKSLTSTGGTAIDVMKNIPSVSVDIDGNVELRNSSPQIFIDGRPTILTLDQIPADNIEKVELITNPSAKFDAASSGGIINIVLKKNKRVGLNGLATLNAGSPKVLGSSLNLNLRQGKLNFFVSGNYNQSGGKANGKTLRQNKDNGTVTDYFNQYSVNDRLGRFRSVRFGVDYFIDNRNTLSVVQRLFKGNFRNNETQDQEYLNHDKVMEYYGTRLSASEAEFGRKSTGLNYKHSFPKEGKELTADISYNSGNNNNQSDITNSYFYPGGAVYEPATLVTNNGTGNNNQVTFQADFVNPVNENKKVEAGIRIYHNEFKSIYNAYADDNGQPVKLPLSNNYKYDQQVNAAYFTYTNKKGKFGYQLGLRAEYSKFDGLLIDSAYKFGYRYPDKISKIGDAFFPSVFLSETVGENNELQFNFSRRIRRPDFWQLNPFIDINDPANLRQGNPQLRPEFINSFEFNFSQNYKKGNILYVLYFRNNPADITQYSDTITTEQYQQLNNAGVDRNAILNTFINASTTNRYGAEFTVQHKFSKNFDITPSLNFQYRTVKADIKGLNLSNKGFNWQGKLATNYKIVLENERSVFNGLGFQLSGQYESPRVIPQGKRDARYSVDMALKREFLKNNKASLTLGVNDVFNTDRYGLIYDTDLFYQELYRRRNVRNFRVTLSYKFGKADFSLMKRNNRNENDD